MFKSLRRRIAIWFLCLSSLVYFTLTLLGMWMFKHDMMRDLNEELRVVESSVGHAIDIKHSVPYFRNWVRTVSTEPAKSLVTIQLYDETGRLLDKFGPPGYVGIVKGRKRQVQFGDMNMEVSTSPLTMDGKIVGYVQLELSTKHVEAAVRQFGFTMMLISPLVLLGLTGSSLLVSGKVIRPLEEHVRLLKRFMSDASHELNTPLSIMQARAESLHKKLSRQGLPVDDVDSIRRSTERMGRMISDLMLLAEVEGSMTSEVKAYLSIDQVINNVSDEFQPRFLDKGVALRCHADQPIRLLGYSDALYRLLSNLLENAVRHTDCDGSVDLAAQADEHQCIIIVQDTGSGIPAESLPLIFDRFYRVDKSRSRTSGGSGLGLSIVKAIAEAHGGHVSVSCEPGVGTRFTVVLPLG